jgi:hypothetical protein
MASSASMGEPTSISGDRDDETRSKEAAFTEIPPD